MRLGVRRGCIRLINGNIGLDDEDKNVFTITDLAVDKTFHFMTKDHEERSFWLKHLEETIKYTQSLNSNGRLDTAGTDKSRTGTIVAGSPQVGKLAHKTENLTLENFEQQQKQIASLRGVIAKQQHSQGSSQENSNSSAGDGKPKKKANFFTRHGTKISNMLNLTDQSIDSLNQAKASLSRPEASKGPAKPTSANYNQPSVTESCYDGSTSSLTSSFSHIKTSHTTPKVPSSSTAFINKPKPADRAHPRAQDQSSSAAAMLDQQVEIRVAAQNSSSGISAPPYSFSSGDESSAESEGAQTASDDDFFDANEGSYAERSTVVSQVTPSEVGSVQKRAMSTQSSTVGDIEFMDEFSDCDDEEEVDMGKQPVIRYLISQVRIGMDLTRIPLPTFILESRSLLEMYAAFFSHPDLFTSIADKTSPRERFLQVTRWYMSSFHAGRKSEIAKKPYNPILGEQFHCIFDPTDGLAEGNSVYAAVDTPAPPIKGDQPLTWAKSHQVQFSAEQVSHHPPISAFYAEQVDKRIQFNGQLWTKSKFLGLSICVHNIGQGVISLLDGPGKGEEYVVTFPSGYGRSILSIPWIELGGQCSISCSKSGYNGTVDFHTKPFYGGKLHRTTTKIYTPQDKSRPAVVLEGEWNGSIKYTTGGHGTFIDTTKMPIFRKYVRKPETQQPIESRQLWKKVTHALRTNNIDLASEGKLANEEKQRADKAEREANNVDWENALFDKSDDLWIFKNSLSRRLGT